MHPAAAAVLNHLHLENAPLLGQGMTSAVYAVDDERAVPRTYRWAVDHLTLYANRYGLLRQ